MTTPPSPLFKLKLGGLVLLVACIPVGGCKGKSGAPGGDVASAGAKTIIQNKGSDTMVNVGQAWAEEYQKIAPDVAVEVSGGGSGVGIAALIKGAIDVASASRDMKPEEVEAAKRNNAGKAPVGFVVGHDALAVYVHKANPIDTLNLEQLAQVFAEGGAVTRWSQLGVTLPDVSDDAIVRVSRQSSSGTYEFFREHVLHNRDFKLGSRDLNGSKEVVELVGSTRTAIGYSGMGYATPAVKMVKIAAKAGAPAYSPSVDNAASKKYALARSLLLYTLGEPQGALKGYIEWIRSDAGQRILEQSGYVPLQPEDRHGR
jgi:phosphate transport system substrate-binding protein